MEPYEPELWRGRFNTVDPEDPDYQFESAISKAIHEHPRIKLYSATRQKVTARAVELIWGLVETENAAIAERIRDHMREME
jgi:hypothetical protein